MHSKRLTIRSVLPVHNYPRPPSNSLSLNLGDSRMMGATQTASVVLSVHLCVQDSTALVVKHHQSGRRKEATVFRVYMGHVMYIIFPDRSLFWCNTIKPRQTLKKTNILLLQVKRITDSVESRVLSTFLEFHSIHLVKEIGRLAFTVSDSCALSELSCQIMVALNHSN